MKVKFYTLGCKVNQYETQALREKFLSLGYEDTSGKVDLYIINTCTVTAQADAKSRQAILRAKRENPQAKIVVTGCLAQLDADYFKNLNVDYIIPQSQKASLTDIIFAENMAEKDIWSLKINRFFNQRAFLKIQDGCDSFCSFCKIPHLRGKSKSRKKDLILEEIERLSCLHKEVVLCGINLALWGKDLTPPLRIEELIEEALKIDSLGRLRLSSLEPSLISEGLLSFLKNPKFCPHLHLPFQSGDDDILAAMNKKERVALYEDTVARARQINPLVAISCDIMLGFPGEKEKNFKNTIDFLERTKPMRMHIFTFSPRNKTPLYKAKCIAPKIINSRRKFLTQMAKKFTQEYREKFLGKTLQMVAEEKENGFISGYTENYLKVYLKAKVNLGDIFAVKVDKIEAEGVFVSINK
jgi:threonylcarbamoyladenosine tRNA methylthiotransferase MtaB